MKTRHLRQNFAFRKISQTQIFINLVFPVQSLITRVESQISRGKVLPNAYSDLLPPESHIHGVMLQLPLQTPNSIDTSKILNLISPEKDVDAIGSTNLGKLEY